jgi:hypothetical protein
LTVLLVEEEEHVATMVVLVETETPSVSLDADALVRLGRLGVTNLALVRDERVVGIVLEGWAFEPAASSSAAVAALAGDDGGARALCPVGQVAVSTVSPHHPKEV